MKITPAEIDAAADAPVCTMLFSRMCPPPRSLSTAIETTAAGIADEMVRPANKPRYVFAAARTIASTIESTIGARRELRRQRNGAHCTPAMSRLMSGVSTSMTAPAITPHQNR